MEKFTKVTGVAAPLMRQNVDTDLIIRIERLVTNTGRHRPYRVDLGNIRRSLRAERGAGPNDGNLPSGLRLDRLNVVAKLVQCGYQFRISGVAFHLSKRRQITKDVVMGSEVRLKQIFAAARCRVGRYLEAGERDLLVQNLHPEIVDELQRGRILPAEVGRDRGALAQSDQGQRGDAKHHDQNQPVAGGDTDEERQADRPEVQACFLQRSDAIAWAIIANQTQRPLSVQSRRGLLRQR